MAATLLLDRTVWDLAVDAAGNIALATEPYSVIQDVASACRLFQGELWYGGTDGIFYFEQVLGRYQPIQLLKDQLSRAALAVPGVLSVVVYLTAVVGRAISGQVQVTTGTGTFVVPLG